MSIAASAASPRLESHDDYEPLLESVRTSLRGITAPVSLFTTDAEGLWEAWLGALPPEERRHHNCHACRRFVEKYGGLVTIDDDGKTHSAVFHSANAGIYRDARITVSRIVERARVTGVHVSSEKVYGTACTYDKKRGKMWSHMCAIPTEKMVYRGVVLDAGQRAAELREDYGTLRRALAEFSPELLKQACAIADSEALYRAEKIQGRLKWLAELREKWDDLRGRWRDNAVWLAVAKAPAGFCHVRASVVGSLLEDLEAGKSFAEVKRSFDAKMHPLQYQRPQAPPSAGNVRQAEEVVAKLGSAGSLRRRFARLEDLKTIWLPAKSEVEKKGGVFGHLLTAETALGLVIAQAPNMTWDKFARIVLPTAEEMSVHVPSHANFHAFVTAADPDAPPIILSGTASRRATR